MRDDKPLPYAAVTDVSPRFLGTTNYRSNNIFLRSLGSSSRNHFAACKFEPLIEPLNLRNCTRGCAGWFVCLLTAAICSVSGLISWILSPTMVRASALISLMAARTCCVLTRRQLLQNIRTMSFEIDGATSFFRSL